MIKSVIAFALSYFLILGQTVAIAQSTAAILPQGKTQFFNNNGDPLTSGKVYFYTPNTLTPKTTWQDSSKTTANANPVILDAGGRAIIYGDGTYRQQVKDRNNNLIYDAVTASAGTGSGTTATGDGDLVGTVKPWAGLVAPNQYAFAYGQEISRSTYSVLFTAITLEQNVSCTSGSPILTGLSDTSQIPIRSSNGLEIFNGAILEATCIPAGSQVISKTTTTITMNNNASLTTNVNGRFFLYGNGNGSTTFNLPDLRGFAVNGRQNMGGTAATRSYSVFNSTGGKGGVSQLSLLTANLPPYTPSGTVTAAGTISQITPAGTNSTSSVTTTTAAIPIFPTGGGGGATSFYSPTSTGTSGTINATGTAAAQIFTGTPVTPTFTNSGSTFVGIAQGGTTSPIFNVGPSISLNYIIKITPDTNSADASGVTSLGGMTGDIACGSGLLCSGNTISSTFTATFDPGQYMGNGGAGSAANGTAQKLRTFTVGGFGAVCDGVTDDTTALNSLSTYLNSIGGKARVVFPGTNCLVYNSGQSLAGSPSVLALTSVNGIHIEGNGSTILVGATFTPSVDVLTFLSCNICTNVSIDGLNLTQNVPVDIVSGYGPYGTQLFTSANTSRLISLKNSIVTGSLAPLISSNTSGIVVENVQSNSSFYGFVGLSGVINAKGSITTNGIDRSVFLRGVKNVDLLVNSLNSFANDVLISNSTNSEITSDINLNYRIQTRTSLTGNGSYITIGNSAALSNTIYKNININVEGDISADPNIAEIVRFIKGTTSATNTTYENIKISGSVIGANRAGVLFNVFQASEAPWTGENVSNITFENLLVTGSATPSFYIDGGMLLTGNLPIVLRDVKFPGDLTLANYTPGTLTAYNAKFANFNTNPSVAVRPSGDANNTISISDNVIPISAVFTSPRTWELPSIATVAPGTIYRIFDITNVGALSSVNTLTLTRFGSDLINNNATSITFSKAGSYIEIIASPINLSWNIRQVSSNIVQGDIQYADATNSLTTLAKDTNTTRYISNTGSSNNPAWAQVNLANGVTGVLPNANLANSSTTVNGQTCTLGSTCTVTAAATSITVGTTTVGSGTTTRVLFDNAGVLGEYIISGSGNVAMTTSPIFTTPNLGTPSALVLTNATGTPSAITLTNGTGLPTTGLTGTLQAAQEPAHTGDVTNSAGSLALTIANNAVTFAKMATQATNTVVGNATSGSAVPTALAVGSCSTASSALIWTTNTGFGCNTSITATAVPVGGITGLGTGVATFLATPSSANLASAVTDETGTGALVFANTPTLVTPVLGAATATSINFGGSTLNFYSKGFWIPTLTGTTSGSWTLTNTAASYVRVGDFVTAWFSLNASSSSSPLGNIQIGGLPYTSVNSANEFFGGSLTFQLGLTNSALYTTFSLIVPINGTNILLYESGSGQTTQQAAIGRASSTPSMVGYVSYRVN